MLIMKSNILLNNINMCHMVHIHTSVKLFLLAYTLHIFFPVRAIVHAKRIGHMM